MSNDEEPTYMIVRFYYDENHPDNRKVILTGLSKEEAINHCNDPGTKGHDWFDGWTEE